MATPDTDPTAVLYMSTGSTYGLEVASVDAMQLIDGVAENLNPEVEFVAINGIQTAAYQAGRFTFENDGRRDDSFTIKFNEDDTTLASQTVAMARNAQAINE